MTLNLGELADHLRSARGIGHKLDIQQASGSLPARPAVTNGDDCAAIPDGDGYLLIAIEGLLDEFVEAEPWFAGYCAVMVNVSDIYAMGGRPIALVDAIWARSAASAGPIWKGMTDAAEKYAVPIVGGHTNSRSRGDHLAAAILGRAGRRLLTSFDARPGDALITAIDLRGEWFGHYSYWNCSTTASGERLRGDLEILCRLADRELCAAAKDISMGGLVGTATMLAECSRVGMTINVDAVPRPPNVALEKWLAAFPSFGFILSVAPKHIAEVCACFRSRDLGAAVVGQCDDSKIVALTDSPGQRAVFWDLREPFIGFGRRS